MSGCSGIISSPDGNANQQNTAVSEVINGRLTQRVWRLSRTEYYQSIAALLGEAVVDKNDPTLPELSPDSMVNGFKNQASALISSRLYTRQMFDAAGYFAEKSRAVLGDLLPCNASEGDSCAESFIKDFGLRAFRRPLSDEEIQEYMALFQSGSDPAFEDGIVLAIQAFLSSPNFLFRPEIGQNKDSQVAVLNDFEIATLLSYMLTESPPDAELLKAASEGTLQNPDTREAQLRRLFSESSETVSNFVTEWLLISDLSGLQKSSAVYPDFDASMAEAMLQETRTFAAEVLVSQQGGFRDLMTANYSWIGAELASFYGVPHPGEGVVRVDLDPAQRAGILTQGSVLAKHARAEAGSPVKRGVFLWRAVLCQDLPDPPPGVPIVPAEPVTEGTTREHFAAHSADPACAGCHTIIDPIGFGLENYDGIGRYREEENGVPVDASGYVPEASASASPNDSTANPAADSGNFTGGVELSQVVVNDARAQNCFLRRLIQRSLGADLGSPDDTEIGQNVKAQFVQSETSVLESWVAMVRSSKFVERAALGGS
ncbi:MAG: DUF1592 domain-containing protein [Myxococcales bacterium]|nr:MAG: DUF1592 domain-containing protein [Myxococcales bacterium]